MLQKINGFISFFRINIKLLYALRINAIHAIMHEAIYPVIK